MKILRKSALVLVWLALVALFSACGADVGEPQVIGSDIRVEQAIKILADDWHSYYREHNIEDEYLQIVNTRIVNIKDDADDLFEDVDYIVEFSLYSNYFGTSPYYSNVGMGDTVVVYKNGETSVPDSNLFNSYRARSYKTDFSPFIESVEDFGGDYNHIVKMNK